MLPYYRSTIVRGDREILTAANISHDSEAGLALALATVADCPAHRVGTAGVTGAGVGTRVGQQAAEGGVGTLSVTHTFKT